MIADLAAAIVAGGASRRMGGINKALIEVEGAPIIERQLAVLRTLTDDVAICGGDAAALSELGVPVVPDPVPDAGPIAGILAALDWSPARRVLCVACDMPFLDARVLRVLVDRATDDVDVVAARVDSKPQPLCAVYSRNCAPTVRQRIEGVKLRASDLLTDAGLRVHWIEAAEIRTLDPNERCFRNVNTPADLP